MIIFPGGVRQKRNFQRGGGVRFVRRYLENPEGRGGHRKNPFRGGGMDIFWNYTFRIFSRYLVGKSEIFRKNIKNFRKHN